MILKMKMQEILTKEILEITPDIEKMQDIRKATKKIIDSLESEIKKSRIKADIFVGGSLAKDTLIKKEIYDVDVFVRFNKRYQEISSLLHELVQRASHSLGWKLQRLHGSRDYFRLSFKDLCFEIIPVIHINAVHEAVNITDLSYFHVFYIRKKISEKPGLSDQIRLAKKFCYAQGCYGAESYIGGFSGYALELLVVYYGGFLKFVRTMAQSKGKIILDPERYYKNKQSLLQEMNEAKLQSPIVFVDPTHKERNALAALSEETFAKFKGACKNFLKSPSHQFFQITFFDPSRLRKEARRRKALFFAVEISTDRQEGDIAGTKLLKFSHFFVGGYAKYFDILKKEFLYDGKHKGRIYLLLKKKKEIIMKGPPITSLMNLGKFKSVHPRTFVKDGIAYAKENTVYSPSAFFKLFKKKNRRVMGDMGITKMRLLV